MRNQAILREIVTSSVIPTEGQQGRFEKNQACPRRQGGDGLKSDGLMRDGLYRDILNWSMKSYSINISGDPNACIIKLRKQRIRSLVDFGAELSLIHRSVFQGLKIKPNYFRSPFI